MVPACFHSVHIHRDIHALTVSEERVYEGSEGISISRTHVVDCFCLEWLFATSGVNDISPQMASEIRVLTSQ